MSKLIAVILIVLGEIFSILAEVAAAKYFSNTSGKFYIIFAKALPVMVLSVLLLLAGYMLGLRSFKNIWIVSAISITSILIAEPIINFAVMNQMPTRGSLIGLIFGILGFISTFLL